MEAKISNTESTNSEDRWYVHFHRVQATEEPLFQDARIEHPLKVQCCLTVEWLVVYSFQTVCVVHFPVCIGLGVSHTRLPVISSAFSDNSTILYHGIFMKYRLLDAYTNFYIYCSENFWEDQTMHIKGYETIISGCIIKSCWIYQLYLTVVFDGLSLFQQLANPGLSFKAQLKFLPHSFTLESLWIGPSVLWNYHIDCPYLSLILLYYGIRYIVVCIFVYFYPVFSVTYT